MIPRVVVIPGVHRDLDKAKQSLRKAGCIDKNDAWIGGKTVVVQVGDQVDGENRDPRRKRKVHTCLESLEADVAVLRFFTDLNAAAKHRGGAVHSLLGNHEIMNIIGDFRYADTGNCQNCERERARLFSPGGGVAREIALTRKVVVKIGKLLFVHAGLSPEVIGIIPGKNVSALNETLSSFCLGGAAWAGVPDARKELIPKVLLSNSGPLFTRGYANGGDIKSDAVVSMLKSLDVDQMIIGHNVHEPGVSTAHGGAVLVCDPGMSCSVLNAPATAVEISRPDLPMNQRKVRVIR